MAACLFRRPSVLLGCKGRVASRILSSAFKHPLNPDHVCTAEAEPLGTGFSQGGKCVGVRIDMGMHKAAPAKAVRLQRLEKMLGF